ncbi:glutamine synthetase III [Ethanoligenens harbinense]|uniref:glutamine synthetase III family protein n=1 Tax=Ethanoligenens harbinense TaxID=253239 RepID=UPI000EA2C11E|nr:glutamine synthetase III [Ethanoligenens harbinense]AYF41176.1 glutamine synthetase type III [Ethanoligenens harbinense]
MGNAKTNPAEIFGKYVFSDAVAKTRLSKATYKSLKKTIELGEPLDTSIADEVAAAIKEWAIDLGATHFTHWFLPMTGLTAEKHDSFISPTGDGKVILSFSGKELIKGEPDASSFPSGGLRETSAARGYTSWDTTSPVFVKEGSLYIPTAFFSYTGEILDKKAPLLRANEALDKQARRVLAAFGKSGVKKVTATVGPEQEYFIVNRDLYNQRLDLVLTGRTLFGAQPPKGQELADQYFGTLRTKIVDFMHDLDERLWELGITAKTKHNEVAPAQHEIALIFDPANVAVDHNQLVLELLQKTAEQHGLAALVHEKPFAGVNGNGKHINWSLSTDEGENLLDPTDDPGKNPQFVIFLAAVIKAVDEYAELLRSSVASAGNDHRLGANEAPPAIISVFVGEELESLIDAVEEGKKFTSPEAKKTNLDVSSLPVITEDKTDRNRTSPFAFTGNKFEFRMCGSYANVAGPAFVLNTIVAEALSQIADRLESTSDIEKASLTLAGEIFKAHKRVIFNGNGYSDEWVAEAEKHGLPNIKNTVLAIKALLDEKNRNVLEKHGVLVGKEIDARYEILLENYAKIINIEALTLVDITFRQLVPAAFKYAKTLSDSIASFKAAGVDVSGNTAYLEKVLGLSKSIVAKAEALKAAAEAAGALETNFDSALAYRENVLSAMNDLRSDIDTLEPIVPADIWPVPVYTDLLFRV